MASWNRDATRLMASSHEARSNLPFLRTSGCCSRSGAFIISGSKAPFMQRYPALWLSLSPETAITFPSRTPTYRPHPVPQKRQTLLVHVLAPLICSANAPALLPSTTSADASAVISRNWRRENFIVVLLRAGHGDQESADCGMKNKSCPLWERPCSG